MDNDLLSAGAAGLAEEVVSLRTLTTRLQAENARLLRLLELTPKQAAPPGAVQTCFFEAPPGPVDRQSPPEVKIDFFGQLFAAWTDIYAVRWENAQTGKAGWLPAVRGRWRKGVRYEDRNYLALTREVLRGHLSGEAHVGLYPLLDGDLCSWLAADFDGQTAMLDALGHCCVHRWQAPLMPRRYCRMPASRSSFAGFRFPPEVILVAVRWYLRYGLSYRDVEELLVERGIAVDQVKPRHTLRYDLRKCIWERTVNPSADAFQGSNP